MHRYDTRKSIKIIGLLLFINICCSISILLRPDDLLGAPTISARYIQAQGTQLVVEVMTGSNPPASAILVQRFPPGVKMLNAQPGVSNYNQGSNTAKWLLRSLRPGRSTIRVTLDRAVRSSDVSAEVRFKPQKGGTMTSVPVSR